MSGGYSYRSWVASRPLELPAKGGDEMYAELPRIQSPNLGCPIIHFPEELQSSGLDVVTAEADDSSAGQLRLAARPSFPGEGEEFLLELKDPEELTERTLPHGESSFTD
jgi:hypothetical protein